MAYDREGQSSQVTTSLLTGLDSFVNQQLDNYKTQIEIAATEQEAKFSNLIAEGALTLQDQLAYRQSQLKGVLGKDKDQKFKIAQQISSLKKRIEMKQLTDDYTNKLIAHENGVASTESILTWLKGMRATSVDPDVQNKLDSEILKQTTNLFDQQVKIISDSTQYAITDKSDKVINEQIANLQGSMTSALLGNRPEVASNYKLQIQALRQTLQENAIEKSTRAFSVATMTGNSNAVSQLDAFNTQISGSDTSTPVKIGGITYDSARQYWTMQRDNYIADNGSNGLFGRLDTEQKENIAVKNSQNLLTNEDIKSAAKVFDALAARPEIVPFVPKLNAAKQDVLQTAADLQSVKVMNAYEANYDINSAFTALDVLSKMGVNVDNARSKILQSGAQIKSAQVNNLETAAQSFIDQGMSPTDALAAASKAGAGSVLSPNQLVTKTENQIAQERSTAQEAGTYQPDPRTTASSEAAQAGTRSVAPTTPPAPPIAPVVSTTQDLSSKYGLVGGAVYRKSDNQVFHNEQEFFNDAGVTSFQNLKFDTNYRPPTANASPTLNAAPQAIPTPTAPAPSPTTYKVVSGDTLSAIAQRLLGSAARYTEIVKLNSIADPNKIQVGQSLILPNK